MRAFVHRNERMLEKLSLKVSNDFECQKFMEYLSFHDKLLENERLSLLGVYLG